MAENIVNPNDEQMYVADADNLSEEYEYEYVELGEGEELPEGVEYEYIEVPAEEEEIAMPSISAQVQMPTAPVQPQSTPVQPEAQIIPEPILSTPIMPQPASIQPQTTPTQPQVPQPETVHNAPEAPIVSSDPYAQVSAPVQPQSTPVQPEEQIIPEPILSAPVQPQPVTVSHALDPFPILAEPSQPIVEEDLNALLDDNDAIKEIDTTELLVDTENDFEHQLFSSASVDGVEEVSIEDILGTSEDNSLSGFFATDVVEEVSTDDLLADMKSDVDLETHKFEKIEETVSVLENEPKFEIAAPGGEANISMSETSVEAVEENNSENEEAMLPTETEILDETKAEISLNDEAEQAVGDFAVLEIESVKETVGPEPVAAPVISEAVELEPVAAPVIPEAVEPEPVIAPVVPEAVEPEPVIAPVVPEAVEPEPVAAPVISEAVEPEPVAAPVVPEAVEPEPVIAPVVPEAAEPEPVVAPVISEAVEPEPVAAPVISEAVEMPQSIPTPTSTSILTPISSLVASDVQEIVQVIYATEPLNEVTRSQLATTAKVVDNQSGLQFFEIADGSILLNAEVEELSGWHLIIFNQNLVPVEMSSRHVEITQKSDAIRLTKVVRQGSEKLEIYNEEEYDFIAPSDGFVKAQKHFIYGRVDDNTGLIINDFVNVDVRVNAGKVIGFEKPVFGWLSGPNGAQVYFARLKNLAISASEQMSEDEEKARQKAAKWYSGSISDKYFEFSLDSQSGEFIGTEEMKNIHVNIGTSSYGWNVAFENGLVMSLKDLQEFETKHGKMPFANGEIVHGALKLKFSNVDKIVVYQTPQYFAYGKN